MTLRALGLWFGGTFLASLLLLGLPMILSGRAFALLEALVGLLIISAIVTVGVSPLCLLYGLVLGWSAPVRPLRTAEGRCAFCRYDLAGLASDAVCPECGGSSID